MSSRMKFICVCGARPNFMKIAPIMTALNGKNGATTILVHTGQHYDKLMSRLFFDELHIPRPDINLNVGSNSHAKQTSRIMELVEPILIEHKPDWLIVVGDVNSTMACSLVASKLGIKIAHVEAGLRSFDRSMPEEINRVITDAISDKLFVTEQSGLDNLRNEGVPDYRIHMVGNVMIDTLLRTRKLADQSTILSTLGVLPQQYAVVTLHRPNNVDDKTTLASILSAIAIIATDMPVIFPIHPRSKKNIDAAVHRTKNLRIIDPLGYIDFLKLMADADMVLTDSGGIQEETTILKVPCLTLRENTERPITITHGTNHLAGVSRETILKTYNEVRSITRQHTVVPHMWDGHAANRIVDHLFEARTKKT